ncbi:LysE family translocator [Solimonas soli]|uniref:LysE family translocator n=1 Tax=Solimonas soli TaxID=413479 RepID=UPI0004B0143D|nr:LysE family transporter [Solimonas soli]
MAAASGLAVFGAVAAAHALGVASPGPDFAIVTRQSLAYGRAAGVWTAAGIGSGIVFHVAYGLFGLGWLLRTWPAALNGIALAGAGFLIWIGARALRAQPLTEAGDDATRAAPGGWRRSYAIGLVTNVLNPKATLFFVALFSTVVSTPMSTTLMLALGLWLPLATFGWFASLALLLSHAGLRRALRRHAHRLDRAMGAVLVSLGIFVCVRTLGAWFYR